MGFEKAVKAKQKLRLAIDGVSGSGKTYSALAIASGMGGKIAVIDTEHGSASLYADRFNFDVLELKSFQIEDYSDAIDSAAQERYDILIIDSTSHAWEALLERIERIADSKYKGNTFRAWAEGTPLQRKLVEKLLSYPGHVIVTCRSKTEYSVGQNEKGKTVPTKIGTAAVQRAGFEYEFTLTMSISVNHVGNITKDRTGKFQDQFIEYPGAEFGERLMDWLAQGVDQTLKIQRLEQRRKSIIEEIRALITRKDSGGNSYFSDAERTAAWEYSQQCGHDEQGIAQLNDYRSSITAILNQRLSAA